MIFLGLFGLIPEPLSGVQVPGARERRFPAPVPPSLATNFASEPSPSDPAGAPPALLALAGAGGSLVGAVGGALGLFWVYGSMVSLDEGDGGYALATGFCLGAGFGAGLATHMANGYRGSTRATLLAPTAVGALGLLASQLVFEANGNPTVALSAVPVAVVVTAVLVERRPR